jgi:hypothetical protein
MRATIGLGLLLSIAGSEIRADALEILSPVSGATVRSGQLVTVRVGPSAGEIVESVRIATSEGNIEASTVSGAPGVFEGQVRVPETAVGPEFVVVAASLAGGRVVSTHVQVEADPGVLRQLVIVQPPALSFVGQVLQLEVRGLFEDGVTRDLTSPDTGTRYETSNATVLGIDPSGLVQARRGGTASVRVQCRGMAATATLSVSVPNPPDNAIPLADPGLDRVLSSLTVVELSGATSSDADGDPLAFLWEQQAGPWVSLRSAGSANASFLSLTVKDSRGATSFPSTVRITVRP